MDSCFLLRRLHLSAAPLLLLTPPAQNANRGSPSPQFTHMSPDQRLDSASLLSRGGGGPGGIGAPGSGAPSFNTPGGPGLGSLRGGPMRTTSAPPVPVPGAGGMAARRARGGLKLSDMGISMDAGGPPPPGVPGAAPAKRLAPPGRLAGASAGNLMSSAFSNFSNVV